MSFFGFCFVFPREYSVLSLTAGVRDWLFIFQKNSSLAGTGATALIYLIQLDLAQFPTSHITVIKLSISLSSVAFEHKK